MPLNFSDQAEYGLTIVEGMTQQGLLKPLMARIGVTKLTHYGAEFDVKAKQVCRKEGCEAVDFVLNSVLGALL